MLRAAGVEVSVDETAGADAEKLNEAFIHFMKTGRPLITIKADRHNPAHAEPILKFWEDPPSPAANDALPIPEGQKSGGPLTPKRAAFAFEVTPKTPARRGEVEKSYELRSIRILGRVNCNWKNYFS